MTLLIPTATFLGMALAAPPGDGAWPLVYQYGVGGLLLLAGLALAMRARQIDPRRPAGRRWLVIFALGFAAYLALQGIMQLGLPQW